MGSQNLQAKLRALPSMERVLSDSRLEGAEEWVTRETLKLTCRRAIDTWREALLSGDKEEYNDREFFGELLANLDRRRRPSLRSVVNATGVVIHTNMGRSPLPSEAVDALASVAAGYSTLEFNLETGHRGHRNEHVEWLFCQLTGAEAALVVNNNASAVLLALAALAGGKEAVVSRGELVEIGGSFRVPDIMRFAGVKLVETGCTNRTHLSDYATAITDDTALLLKVHPSNFKMTGFTHTVPRQELAELARQRGCLFMEDVGSGLLVEGESLGLDEPSVKSCLDQGCDLVTFSGDKMLGGPQMGVIVGRKTIIDRLRRFQLLRALRCDKLQLAAMEAVLRLYLAGKTNALPTLSMIQATPTALYSRAQALKDRIDTELADYCLITSLVETEDAVGGGSCPETPLRGWAVALRPQSPLTSGTLSIALRRCTQPVVVGGRDGNLLLHLRTLTDEDCDVLIESLAEALEACNG